MNYKEKFLEVCNESYNCIEDSIEDGVAILTFGKESEAPVLNFEINDNNVIVSIINSNNDTVIDSYEDAIDAESGIESIFDTAVKTYEAINSFKLFKPAKVEEDASNEVEIEEDEHSTEITEETKSDDIVSKVDSIIEDLNNVNKDDAEEIETKIVEDIILQLEGIKLELTSLLED